MWLRLRQIALVAENLAAVLDDFNAVLGLEVCFNDPGVATFGLENALMPVGQQFIEVVAPTREGTAGGRQLQKRGGDGGYMVINHTDDHAAVKQRVTDLGVRTVLEFSEHGYDCLQLHPSDTGGSFLEIDFQTGGEDMSGPWAPAGKNWQPFVRTDVVKGINGVEIQVADPAKVAARWSEIVALDVVVGAGGHPTVPFANADIRFVPVTDGRGDGLGGIDLVAVDADRARAAAAARGKLRDDGVIMICGMRLNLVEA